MNSSKVVVVVQNVVFVLSLWRCHVCGYRVGDGEKDKADIESKTKTRFRILMQHYEENHAECIVDCKNGDCKRKFPKEFMMRGHFKQVHLQTGHKVRL